MGGNCAFSTVRFSRRFFLTAMKKKMGIFAAAELSIFKKLGVQPDTRVVPVAISGGRGQPQRLASLIDGKARKVPQFYNLGRRRIVQSQLGEGFINGQQLVGSDLRGQSNGIDIEALQFAAAFLASLFTSAIYKNAPHRLGRRGEEVAAAVPTLSVFDINESKVSFVHQGRGLQRLARRFVCDLLSREPSQLVVDDRKQLHSSLRIAMLDGGQYLGDIGHGNPGCHYQWFFA